MRRSGCATEVASLVENGVHEVVDRPTDKPVITSKSVCKKERELSGKDEKYEAKLVVRGFMEGVGLRKNLLTYCQYCILVCKAGGGGVPLNSGGDGREGAREGPSSAEGAA